MHARAHTHFPCIYVCTRTHAHIPPAINCRHNALAHGLTPQRSRCRSLGRRAWVPVQGVRGVVVGGVCCEDESLSCEGSSMAELFLSRAGLLPSHRPPPLLVSTPSRRAAFVGVCGISVRGIPVVKFQSLPIPTSSGQVTAFGHELVIIHGAKIYQSR